jgi:hypothetical protein
MKSILLWLGGSFLVVLSIIRALLLVKTRLRRHHTGRLLEKLRSEGCMFVVHSEMCDDADDPRTMMAICWLGFPFILSIEERILRAGFNAVDSLVTVTVPRPFAKRLQGLANDVPVQRTIPVHILHPWEAEKVAEIPVDGHGAPLMEKALYADLESEICSCLETGRRVGAILYGKPGNGKTFFGRWLAQRFHLPVYIVAFNADSDNHSIIRMFSHIRGPALVLMEDFDSYFNVRKPCIENQKFTFDIVLNVLDGMFAPRGPIITLMTVNDIQRVDVALKDRPSRFRFVIEVPDPPATVRRQVLGHVATDRMMSLTDGMSLDRVLHVKDCIENGRSWETVGG